MGVGAKVRWGGEGVEGGLLKDVEVLPHLGNAPWLRKSGRPRNAGGHPTPMGGWGWGGGEGAVGWGAGSLNDVEVLPHLADRMDILGTHVCVCVRAGLGWVGRGLTCAAWSKTLVAPM